MLDIWLDFQLQSGLSIATIGVTLLSTLISISLFIFGCRTKRAGHEDPWGNCEYLDEDESATKDSLIRFYDGAAGNLPIICAVVGLLGTALRCALPVIFLHQWSPDAWLQLGAWGLLFVQIVVLRLKTIAKNQFALGILVASSSTCLLLNTSWMFFQDLNQASRDESWGVSFFVLDVAPIIATLLIDNATLNIPARPDTFKEGKLVDRQSAASAFEKYSFNWARWLLNIRSKSTLIDFADLPLMAKDMRAEKLSDALRLEYFSIRSSLFLLLYKSNRWMFHRQWALTVAQSVVAYGPQYCMYKMLRLLEERPITKAKRDELWLWAIGIGMSRLLLTLLETRVTWLSFATVAISMRSQLSAAICKKCMWMSQVGQNQSRRSEEKSENTPGSHSEPADEEDKEEVQLLAKPEQDDVPLETVGQGSEGTREETASHPVDNQNAINLLSVDAQRISDFCSYSNIFPNVSITMMIAIIFLTRLIGWTSLAAGLIASFALMPLNSWSSKHYNSAQSDLMIARDRKVQILTEALQGIRQIKLSATEEQWQEKVTEARTIELKNQWKVFFWALALRFCWFLSPMLLAVASLAIYAWQHGNLSASLAFTSLAVFGNLEWCLSVVPLFIAQLLDARVSAERIHGLLSRKDWRNMTYSGDVVELRNAVVEWPGYSEFKLHATLRFPRAQLSVIYGQSGSGKSLLLSSLIGEAKLRSGKMFMPTSDSEQSSATDWIQTGCIAYVAQVPWLENATIRDNILFGLPFKKDMYDMAIDASALLNDLAFLADGDLTEIGARGINLSGGQKWRVSLARALYSRADILILDDIFSAVDAHVGRHIFERALIGDIYHGRTVILVTHHTTLCLPSAAYIVEVREHEAVGRENPSRQSVSIERGQQRRSLGINDEAIVPERNRQNKPTADTPDPKKFVEDEFREQGSVKWSIYRTYLRASGGFTLWTLAMASVAASQLALLGRGWWMKLWTESRETPTRTLTFWLSIYVSISFFAALLEIVKCALVYTGGIMASRSLFSSLITRVLRAQVRWLDTVPLGRILNRFTADFNAIDSKVPAENHALFSAGMSLVCVFVAGLSLSPFMAIPYLVLLALSSYYTARYISAAREIRRLDATARSPILDLFSNAMLGIDTLRAFGKSQNYVQQLFDRIDHWSQSTWAFWIITQWMSLRMGVMGAIFTCSIAVAIVVTRHIDASLAGFVLIFALNFSKGLEDTIKRSANFQFNMNSIERVVEFTEMETERQDGGEVPASWPSDGRVDIEHLTVSYAPDAPPVLQNLDLHIEPGQRVGIVGRTGAGKSSLTLALFRCLEARGGRISVDGIDIATVKLETLRSRMTLIPQDPVLFSGTIRSNLDPFDQFTDEDLVSALSRVHIFDSKGSNHTVGSSADVEERNFSPFASLSSPVQASGQNLSQGQRQLLCLARAILTKSKILVLDEPTSAVDMATDVLIQRSIREHFSECTLIVIAHRLQTVADFDKVVVLAEGRVAEVGSPKELMEQEGLFWGMLHSRED